MCPEPPAPLRVASGSLQVRCCMVEFSPEVAQNLRIGSLGRRCMPLISPEVARNHRVGSLRRPLHTSVKPEGCPVPGFWQKLTSTAHPHLLAALPSAAASLRRAISVELLPPSSAARLRRRGTLFVVELTAYPLAAAAVVCVESL